MNLLSNYDRFGEVLPATGALAAFRQAGFEYASKHGLPTKKDEEWHYTSVKILGEVNFMPSAFNPTEPSHETLKMIKNHLNPAFTNLVFFNGVLNKTLTEKLPEGVSFKQISEFSGHFDDTFDALNGAYAHNYETLVVEKETSIGRPLHLLNFTSLEGGPALMVQPRLRVEVGARASVKIIESFYGTPGVSYFVNSVADLHLGESSKVTYVRAQVESEGAVNIGRTRITVEKNVELESLAYATGAGLSRHSMQVTLKGPGSHSQILGAYAVQGSQHLDNTSLIDHAVGDCNTHQLYKGILDGQSTAVFCGKVLIQKGAQKANSAQLNNNLLLSGKAEADSKPSLEIYADDVKAAHGSTVGQLNSDELFYLLSRAIPRNKAISMLSHGFLAEVLLKISDESIQKWLIDQLNETFTRLHVD